MYEIQIFTESASWICNVEQAVGLVALIEISLERNECVIVWFTVNSDVGNNFLSDFVS